MTDRVQMTLRLSRRTKERLVALAALRGVPAAEIAEEALAAYLDALGEAERRDLAILLELNPPARGE